MVTRRRVDLSGWFNQLILVAWTLVVLAPMAWVLLSSFKTSREIFASPFSLPERLSWNNYLHAWTDAGIGRYFFNTVLVVSASLVLVMTLGSMCAYVLARYKFFGRRVIYYSMVAGMTVPVFLAIVPLFFVLQRSGLLNTWPGLVLVYVAFALPFTVFFLYPFFAAIPQEVEEAAYVDGAGDFRRFVSVMLPMAKNGLASVAIFNFLGLWNQYLLPLVFNTDPANYVLAQGMGRFASQAGYSVDFGALFAAVVITAVPVIALYLVFQKQLREAITTGSVK